MKQIVIPLIVFLGVAFATTFGGTITLSTAELQSFTLTSGTNIDFSQVNPVSSGVRITANFAGMASTPVTGSQATFGTNVVKNWVAGTFFSLSLINQNENPWEFELILNGVSVASQGVAVDQLVNFNVDIGAALGGGSGVITSVEVRVSPLDASNTTPLIGSSGDEQAEFSVVSEPTSMLLLGLGVLVAGVTLRRRT